MNQSAIDRAVSVCGSQTILAEKIGVTLGAVNQWVHGHRPIPPGKCIPIEEACGGQVTRYDLRPDVFGEAAA